MGWNSLVGNLVQNVTLGAIDRHKVEDALDGGQKAIDSVTGKAQANAIEEGTAEQQSYLEKNLAFQQEIYGDLKAEQKPWVDAGKFALDQLASGAKAGSFNYKQFAAPVSRYSATEFGTSPISAQGYSAQGYTGQGYDAANYSAQGYTGQGYDAEKYNASLQGGYKDFDFDYEKSPGYEFLQKENLEAVTNAMAARGLGSGGAEKKALMERATNLAAQDYGNQYSRAMQTHNQNYGQFFNRESANQNALNQASQFNTSASNQANAFRASALNNSNQFNASSTNQANQFNAGSINQANAFNASALNSSNAFNAGANNQANQFTASQNNAMSQFNSQQALQAQQLTDNASRYYDQNQYDRYLDSYRANVASKDSVFNKLSQLAGMGQSATNATQNAGSSYANSSGNIYGQMGSNALNNLTGQAAASTTGMNNLLNLGATIYGAG